MSFCAKKQGVSTFLPYFCTNSSNSITTVKDFLLMMRRYVAPYQRYLAFSLSFNVLSAMLNIFSFLSIVPMLNLLFGTDQTH